MCTTYKLQAIWKPTPGSPNRPSETSQGLSLKAKEWPKCRLSNDNAAHGNFNAEETAWSSSVWLLPDKRLQDGRGGTFLKLQLLVVQGFGICSAFGSSFPQQNNAIIVSQWQRTLERRSETKWVDIKRRACNYKPATSVTQVALEKGSLPATSTLSLCSMNSAKFRRVWVTSAMSWEVRANSMLRINSSCWSSFSSDQHETKAALKRSLRTEGQGHGQWLGPNIHMAGEQGRYFTALSCSW